MAFMYEVFGHVPFAPLKSEIIDKNVVMLRAILPGTRSDGMKFEQAEAMQSIALGT